MKTMIEEITAFREKSIELWRMSDYGRHFTTLF